MISLSRMKPLLSQLLRPTRCVEVDAAARHEVGGIACWGEQRPAAEGSEVDFRELPAADVTGARRAYSALAHWRIP